jgi:hypothetical protein
LQWPSSLCCPVTVLVFPHAVPTSSSHTMYWKHPLFLSSDFRMHRSFKLKSVYISTDVLEPKHYDIKKFRGVWERSDALCTSAVPWRSGHSYHHPTGIVVHWTEEWAIFSSDGEKLWELNPCHSALSQSLYCRWSFLFLFNLI